MTTRSVTPAAADRQVGMTDYEKLTHIREQLRLLDTAASHDALAYLDSLYRRVTPKILGEDRDA